jgi:hypothetical protein
MTILFSAFLLLVAVTYRQLSDQTKYLLDCQQSKLQSEKRDLLPTPTSSTYLTSKSSLSLEQQGTQE